jgi:prolyl 4-hydroxylase
MEESVVLDSKSGSTKKSDIRTSTGTFLARGHDAVISTIEKRVAAVTMIPVGEALGYLFWLQLPYCCGCKCFIALATIASWLIV